MGMTVKVISHRTSVMNRLEKCIYSAMEEMKSVAKEWVQYQMLYGYSTPHGKDGHTEIYETGVLSDEANILTAAQRDSQNTFTVSVGSNIGYAPYVHNGTYKLEARPFIDDAMDAHKGDAEKIYAAHMQAMSEQ